MSTPHHISANYEAVLKKIESANVDEAQKMFYRAFLDQTKESTNGRTVEEKIQDLTEAVAGLAQMSISRQLESSMIEQELTSMKRDLDTIKQNGCVTGNEALKQVSALKTEIKTVQGPKKAIDKILDFMKNMPWSVTVLGICICGLLAYKPQFIEFFKLIFFK